VKDLQIDGENVSFAIELTTPACPVRDQMKEDAHRAVLSLSGVTNVAVAMTSKVRGTQSEQKGELIPLVKNVVPVASGKGGVGKSTRMSVRSRSTRWAGMRSASTGATGTRPASTRSSICGTDDA
jgi:hypothetical protein